MLGEESLAFDFPYGSPGGTSRSNSPPSGSGMRCHWKPPRFRVFPGSNHRPPRPGFPNSGAKSGQTEPPCGSLVTWPMARWTRTYGARGSSC